MGLILAANLAALWVLFAVLRPDGELAASTAGLGPAAPGVGAPAPGVAGPQALPPGGQVRTAPGATAAPAGPGWLETEAGAALERDLHRVVTRWIEQARKLTKNRVHADNVAVAVHVRELGAGPRAQVGFGADRALRPASNMKLVTTAAALVLLGPDWCFETAFESAAPVVDGVLHGDLVARAGGDPLYAPGSDGEVEGLLAPVAAALAARGVRSIAGDLVLDEGSFADPAPGPEWPDEGQYWTEYCALAGGFSANRGALSVEVVPGRPGQPAAVRLRPAAHGLAEQVAVRTTDGGRLTVAFHARAGGVLVKGTIPASVPVWHEAMAHPDPVELFGHVLVRALARGGVELGGGVRRERGVALGGAGRELAVLRSPWMPLLAPINTDSANSVADQLFLATGLAVRGAGTRAAAAEATAEALGRLGVSAAGLVQVDGSGLSRANRVTAAQMTALLEAVLSGSAGSAEAFVQSLALAGETGTLDDRMRAGPARGRVRAKTGFIGGTSALSGVAEAQGGRAFVFSVLVNYPVVAGLNTSCWKPMQDEICERLVEAGP